MTPSQRSLYNTDTKPRGMPKLLTLQPSPLQQLLPLALPSLHASKCHHHLHIKRGFLQRCSSVGKDPLIDEDLRVAWCHGRSDVLENADAFLVVPVVEIVVQEIDSGAWIHCQSILSSSRDNEGAYLEQAAA